MLSHVSSVLVILFFFFIITYFEKLICRVVLDQNIVMYFVPDIFLLFTTCARLVEIRLRALYQVQAMMQPDEDRLDLPPPSHALSVTPWPIYVHAYFTVIPGA